MKIGDKVRVRTDKNNIPLDFRGCEVIILAYEERLNFCKNGLGYWVRIKNIVEDRRWFCWDELEVIK